MGYLPAGRQVRYSLFFLAINLISRISAQDLTGNQPDRPLIVRENKGQWDQQILYKCFSFHGASVSFLKNGLSFGFGREKTNASVGYFNNREYLVWNVTFLGQDSSMRVVATGKEISRANYFKGNNVVLNAADYNQLFYQNIYKNIDLRYYGKSTALEYDYVIHAGGNNSDIRMQFEGTKGFDINPAGELEIKTEWGLFPQPAPYAYQLVEGEKIPVQVSYCRYNETTYGFKINGPYNKESDLIIDPIILKWATYVDGAASQLKKGYTYETNGYQFDIAIDAAGNAYGTGYEDNSFPVTPGAFNTTFAGDGGVPTAPAGSGDVFVYKLSSDGKTLIWATYVGGSMDEVGRGIKVSAAGNVYVTGFSSSTNFPVTANACKKVFNNANHQFEGFVFELDANATSLLYSTYLGGDWGDNFFYGLSLTSTGEAIASGSTDAYDYPVTPGAFQTAAAGGGASTDAIVSCLNSTGSALVYSTFIGGNGYDYAYAMDIDPSNNVYLTGTTDGGSGTGLFPTTAGVFQPLLAGMIDAFVLELKNDGSSLVYSSFLGGSKNDLVGMYTTPVSYSSYGMGISVNSKGEAFVTGSTESSDFPVTAGAFQTALNGTADAYVCRINAAGSKLIYSTLYGGAGQEAGFGIAVNAGDEAFFAGATNSNNKDHFPTTLCTYDSLFGVFIPGNGYIGGGSDTYLAKLNPSGTQLRFSTFYGGSDWDYSDPRIEIPALGCSNEVIMGLTTHSWDIPMVAGSYKPKVTQTQYSDDHPVIVKFSPVYSPPMVSNTSPQCNAPLTFTAGSSTCGRWDTLFYRWNFGDGTLDSGTSVTHSYAVGGSYTVKLIANCPQDTVTELLNIPTPIKIKSSTVNALCGASDGSILATASGGTGSNYTYSWTNGSAPLSSTVSDSTSRISGLIPGTYYVTVTENNGCVDTAIVTVKNSPVLIFSVGPNASICPGDTARLLASGAIGYNWTPALGLSSPIVSTPLAFPAATTRYQVTGTAGSCTGTDSILVTVYNPPKAITGKDTVIVSGTSVTLSASGGSGYLWTTSSSQASSSLSSSNTSGPVASPTVTTTYIVVVTDSNGCKALDSVTVFVDNDLCSANAVYLPSAFSPNGDGENDLLYVRGICIQDLTFIVFDRWGEKVFETTSLNTPWDGTFRGQKLNQAVFAWSLSATLYNGATISKKGNVTLLR